MNTTKEYGHLMIDLETMGNGSNSVICAIGARQFNLQTEEIGQRFYEKISIQSCLDARLKVDGSTIEWWLVQSEEARQEIVKDCLPLTLVLRRFHVFFDCLNNPETQVWGNGSRFDLGILRDAYRAIDSEPPWMHNKERDVRTLVSLNPSIKERFVNDFTGVKHRADEDCLLQIRYLCATYNSIYNSIKNDIRI